MNVFQAVGMGRESLLFAILRKIVIEIPALLLLNALFPLYGLPFAQAIAEFMLAIAGTIVLTRFIRQQEAQAARRIKSKSGASAGVLPQRPRFSFPTKNRRRAQSPRRLLLFIPAYQLYSASYTRSSSLGFSLTSNTGLV